MCYETLSLMNPLRFFSTNSRIEWGMPQEHLVLFSSEHNCTISSEAPGMKEVCRYEMKFQGGTIYVNPLFSEKGLIHFKANFDQENNLLFYQNIVGHINNAFAQPVYQRPEIFAGDRLTQYPCAIWLFDSCILEAGVHSERWVDVGYLCLTHNESFRSYYTVDYLATIGWRILEQK